MNSCACIQTVPSQKFQPGYLIVEVRLFSRGISCGISRVIATLITKSPRNCPTPLNTLAYFLIRSPALCQLRWSNSHFHYQFDQFNIQPAQGLSSSDAAVCKAWNLWCFTSFSVGSQSTPCLSMSRRCTFLLQRWILTLSSSSRSCCGHTNVEKCVVGWGATAEASAGSHLLLLTVFLTLLMQALKPKQFVWVFFIQIIVENYYCWLLGLAFGLL